VLLLVLGMAVFGSVRQGLALQLSFP